jgi:transposase InsO family protein
VEAAAREAAVSARTLREWVRGWTEDRLRAKPRGRRLRNLSPEDHRWAIFLMALTGPKLGLRALGRELRVVGGLEGVARGEIIDLQRRYRRVWERLFPVLLHRLSWSMPGAVWAMDHTCTPCRVDGQWKAALTVRDLASGEVLGFVPQDETAEAVNAALDRLLEEHGAPLVLKSDNGSAFTADVTRRHLMDKGVHPLLSPARTPRYNGSVESTQRHLKEAAAHVAALRGRGEAWATDDLEAARMLRNALSFPRGHGGRTAQEVWESRVPISAELRSAFGQSVAEEELKEKNARGLGPGVVPGRRLGDTIRRKAVSRALVAHGILSVRRRLVPLPFNSPKRANIS